MGIPKHNNVGGSKIEVLPLPRDFYRFLKDISSTAFSLATEFPRFKQVSSIASTILVSRGTGRIRDNDFVRSPYIGMSSRECFKMFYEHIQQPYTINTKETVELMGGDYGDETIHSGLTLEELKQLDDARPNADSHTKFTTGRFEIKEWRINV